LKVSQISQQNLIDLANASAACDASDRCPKKHQSRRSTIGRTGLGETISPNQDLVSFFGCL
jgi:hypothetical protein